MTEREKDKILARAVAYVMQDPKINREIWQLLANEMFHVMAKVNALEKKAEAKELDAKIKNRK
jgi:hypothetical protein